MRNATKAESLKNLATYSTRMSQEYDSNALNVGGKMQGTTCWLTIRSSSFGVVTTASKNYEMEINLWG
jgi:hypothetical protein